MTRIVATAVAMTLLVALPVAAQELPAPSTVGEPIYQIFETDHPYAGSREPSGLIDSIKIDFPGATYIAPHFSRFDLAPGDYVIVRSPDNSRSWRYEGHGKGDLGVTDGFWGVHIVGQTAIVELYGRTGGNYGFTIDRFARGFTPEEMGIDGSEGAESLCGPDDQDWAPCYDPSDEYERGRAVARLLMNGFTACTGWLVGDEGHLMTNNHCIPSQSTANNTDYEFMAEGAFCTTNCSFWWACPGTIEATSGTLVQTDFSLDYTLIELPTNVSSTYGFLQLRETPAILGEQIYSGQHPSGWGKRLAIDSSHPENPSGFAEVDSLTEPTCQGGGPPEVGYYMDTQGGSSGSPVLGTSDDCVIALHHCRGSFACTSNGGDPNRGVPIPDIIAYLGNNLPNNALCDPPGPFTLSMSGQCPGEVVVTTSGGSGSGAVMTGTGLGSDVIPGGDCAGTVTGLSGLSLLAGDVTLDLGITANAPSSACGLQMQVIDLSSCELTNVEAVP